MTGPELIVFDCDGVLVDSEVLANAAVADLLSAWIPALDADAFSSRFAGVSDGEIIDILAAEHGVTFPADLEARIERAIDDRLAADLQPVAGVAEALAAIAQPKALASNSPRHRVEASLARAAIAGHFGDRLFVAAMAGRPKPAPDVYALAARTLGAEPARCLAVEDSVAGVTSARAAGMAVLGFTGGAHTWPGHAAALRDAGAGTTVAAMADLPAAVAGIRA